MTLEAAGCRVYLIGTISSEATYNTTTIEEKALCRETLWRGEVKRDLLSIDAKNSLGAIMTLFRLTPEVVNEMDRLLSNDGYKAEAMATGQRIEAEKEAESQLLKDIQARSLEFIKDLISRLDWEQLQTLVADILRTLGYKARVSSPGADRGKDIIASRDGFGFEQPRIVVEVEHRKEAMGAQEIRSFLGGRHKDDKGLYVSTGGFSKEARYEAERASIPLTLMDLDALVEAVLENYEKISTTSRLLVPLTKIYWPLSSI